LNDIFTRIFIICSVLKDIADKVIFT